MKLCMFAIFSSVMFACASDQPVDDPQDAGAEPQVAERAAPAQPDDLTASLTCSSWSDDETTSCVQQFEEGEDDTHWYTPIWPFPWPWGHHRMDPEPDRNKDRRHCDDWCSWDWRQCRKVCRHKFPEPYRDWWKRAGCYNDCDRAADKCLADCQKKFPERPIITVEPQWPSSSQSNK